MKKSIIILIIAALCMPAYASTVAHWRFEDGPADEPVRNPLTRHDIAPDGTFYPGVVDHSGNGNHLSAWTEGGGSGFLYKDDVPFDTIPGSDTTNNYSIKDSGEWPALFSDSAVSNPTGVDIEAWSPSAWTIEATFKPESGNHRTIVGRDSLDYEGMGNVSALYFQIQPDDSVAIKFADVAGNWQEAVSEPGLIQGFDFPTDPEGENGNWYSMSAVSDGTMLSLYLLDITNGGEWELVAQTDMSASESEDTALAIGAGEGEDWHAGGWSVGRGMWEGGHGDRAYGYIDEVRLSEGALTTGQFLVPEPATLIVLGLGSLVLVRKRRS